MSDIPVGTPPAPPGRHAAPSGWYADPTDGGQERYWDGWQWSRNTRPREGAAAAAPVPGYPQPPYGQSAQPGPGAQPPYPQGHPQQGYPQQGGAWNQPVPAGRPGQALTTTDGVRLAGWWWRVLAGMVDSVIVSILAAVVSLPLLLPVIDRFTAYFAEAVRAAEQGRAQPPINPDSLISVGDQFLLALIGAGVTIAYHVLFLRWKAATPGKLTCGLRVVPVDQGRFAAPLSWRAVVVRALVWAAPGLQTFLFLFHLLDALFPLWQPKRQALHDLAARTQVTRP